MARRDFGRHPKGPRLRPGSSSRRRLLSMAAVVLALALAGCSADVSVEIDAEVNGAGTVAVRAVLDKAAAATLGGRAGIEQANGDLVRSGWDLQVGPTSESTTAGGRPFESTTVVATHRFGTPAEATRLIEQLSGPKGPFGGLRLARHRGLLSRSISVKGDVDLRGGPELFGDDGLAARVAPFLPGRTSKLGPSAADIERILGRPLQEAVSVSVRTRLAGKERSVALPWGALTSFTASASQRSARSVALVGGAVIALLLGSFITTTALRAGRRRAPRSGRPEPRGSLRDTNHSLTARSRS